MGEDAREPDQEESRAESSGSLLVLTGTTASGKSELGLLLAERLRGEIVSFDSMQVYRGMDIGTAKPRAGERARIPHHLIDIRDPSEAMNVSAFIALAAAAIDDIRSRGREPVIVGGTALYVATLIHGVFEGQGADVATRSRLKEEARALGVKALHERLASVDPAAARRIHPSDYRRIERALEVHALTGKPITVHQTQWYGAPIRNCAVFVLTRERSDLIQQIDLRVDKMMAEGFLEEVRGLRALPALAPEPANALGYKQLLAHLEGRCSLENAVELTKIATRQFAKRQMTWFRRVEGAHFVSLSPGTDLSALADAIVANFRSHPTPARVRRSRQSAL